MTLKKEQKARQKEEEAIAREENRANNRLFKVEKVASP